MQIFQLIFLNLPRISLTSNIFIKKILNFASIKFRGTVLSQFLVHLICSFPKKYQNFNLFEYVCVRVCVRLCMCV